MEIFCKRNWQESIWNQQFCFSLGALPEIVGNAGFIINERVGSEEYFEKFKMATMELLTNDELWSKISLNGKMRAKNTFASEMLVERFEKILERLNLPK